MSAISEARHRADAQTQHAIHVLALDESVYGLQIAAKVDALDEAIRRVRALERALAAARANLKGQQRNAAKAAANGHGR